MGLSDDRQLVHDTRMLISAIASIGPAGWASERGNISSRLQRLADALDRSLDVRDALVTEDLAEAAAERDVLGEAAFAAFAAAGRNTDGCTTWRGFFRPIARSAWVLIVRSAVEDLREERDTAKEDREAAEQELDALNEGRRS